MTLERAPTASERGRAPVEPAPEGDPAAGTGHGGRRWISILLPLGWSLGLAVAFVLPTLVHGPFFAPFDLLNQYGLGHHQAAAPHNVVDSDLIMQDTPWLDLAWHQVRAGHLPLWNPYNGEGLPLGTDNISAAFSLPALLAYTVPVRDAFLVEIVAKLVIAGTGAWALGRTLGLRRSACLLTAAVYELSGAFTVWLGWSHTAVMAWAGWVFAAALLVTRGERRVRAIVLLALAVAAATYGGHPESEASLVVGVGLLAAVVLGTDAWRNRRWRRAGRGVVDLVLGGVAGLGLSAPLWMAATQLGVATPRYGTTSAFRALPLHDLVGFAFQGYFGLPIAGHVWHNTGNYYEITAFVGTIPLGLAAVAVVTRFRRPEVAALGTVVLAFGLLIFFPPVLAAVAGIGRLGAVDWYHGLMVMALAVAALAGVGLQAVLDHGRTRTVSRALGAAFGVLAALVAALALLLVLGRHHFPSGFGRERAGSFFWPALGCLVGLAVAIALSVAGRHRAAHARPSGGPSRPATAHRLERWGAGALVTVATLFLVLTGSPLWTAGQPYFPSTSGEARLAAAVGDGKVGFVTCPSVVSYPDLGILVNANTAYRIHELPFYNASSAPTGYGRSLAEATGRPVPPLANGQWCPSISDPALARRYGVHWVLAPVGTATPAGMVRRATIDGEELLAVPGAAAATIVPDTAPAGRRATGTGPQVTVHHPDDATWSMAVDAVGPSRLDLRLTDVPGWHVTVDGRTVPVSRWDAVMQSVAVPPGHHLVVATYWPEAVTVGLVVAAVTAIALGVASVVAWRRRRSRAPGAGTRPEVS